MFIKRGLRIIIFLCGILFILFCFVRLTSCYHTPDVLGAEVADSSIQEKQTFAINQNENIRSIGMRLETAGIITSEKDFVRYMRKKDLVHTIRTGTYALAPSMSLESICNKITQAPGASRSFTIPNGATLQDIAQILSDEDIVSSDEFWEAVVNGNYSEFDFLKHQPHNTHRLEGFLYPDTYVYKQNMSAEDLLTMMLENFQRVYASLPDSDTGLDIRETVILASLIEKETFYDQEKPLIASVYMNRLESDMPLQCDASILYDMPYHRTLTFSDYQYDSPYNTYLFTGFPPTAIANPGKLSLMAALSPAKTKYKFYLLNTETQDRHVFSETYEEHKKNRVRYGYDG